MVHEALKAADELEKEGYSAEVVDLRTLVRLILKSIIASVEKTNRAIVVQEAQKQAGIAANVVAEINERAILSLEAPVLGLLLRIRYIRLPRLNPYGFRIIKILLKQRKKH